MTEPELTKEVLKECEKKFFKALQECPLAVTLTSAVDHRYIEVNGTFERISIGTSTKFAIRAERTSRVERNGSRIWDSDNPSPTLSMLVTTKANIANLAENSRADMEQTPETARSCLFELRYVEQRALFFRSRDVNVKSMKCYSAWGRMNSKLRNSNDFRL